MPSRNRGRLALLAGGVALGALVFTALLLIELLVDAPFRKTAMRLVVATVLAIAAYRVRTRVGLGVAQQPRSTFNAAGEPAAPPARERTRFDQLHDAVRSSTRNQRYFDAVFWPRIVSLAEAKTGEPADWLLKPPSRSFGRGPSLVALRDLVASIEVRR